MLANAHISSLGPLFLNRQVWKNEKQTRKTGKQVVHTGFKWISTWIVITQAVIMKETILNWVELNSF